MIDRNHRVNDRYDSLTSPLKSISAFVESTEEALTQEEGECIQGRIFKRIGTGAYKRGAQILRAGDLDIIVGRTTPVQSKNISEHCKCFLTMTFIGGFTTKEKWHTREVHAGDIHLDFNNYREITRSYSSSLFVALDPGRLSSTTRIISGGGSLTSIDDQILVKSNRRDAKSGGTRKMWRFIEFVDALNSEDQYLPSALGLSEQFYRLLSITLLENTEELAIAAERWKKRTQKWTNNLDDLIDFIRTNADQNLTLTDLEQLSHYSARHLQNLFKEKFDCTPMQFVRRQRLTSAMEKLQTADYDATVTSIGRDCGYRFTSNFTTDFHRQFGVTPSTVLRASRGGVEIGSEALVDADL